MSASDRYEEQGPLPGLQASGNDQEIRPCNQAAHDTSVPALEEPQERAQWERDQRRGWHTRSE